MPAGFENKKSKTKASFTPSINSKDITTKFQEYFTQIKDPRVERTRYHLLTDIITIAILAVIAGAEGWEDIDDDQYMVSVLAATLPNSTLCSNPPVNRV
jgi:hypothetical protein